MKKGLLPGGKFARVMTILHEGPSMAAEIAAEMEITSPQASALLCDLKRRGYTYSTVHSKGLFSQDMRLWHAREAA